MIEKTNLPLAAFVAENATVRGDVTVGKGSSIFFGAVVRTELVPITIGEDTNIQDNCILHTDAGFPLSVGSGCTIGHGTILHGCTVGDNTLIGMGAIVLSGARIGQNCIVGAGALVTGKTVVPDGWMAFGNPAKPVRRLKAAEIEDNLHSAALYVELKEGYRK